MRNGIRRFLSSTAASFGLGIVAALMLVLAYPASSFAATAMTTVSGTVTNNGKTVSGAKVTVVCDGHTEQGSTNSKGVYDVQFTAKNCPDGSKVTVTATKGDLSGTNKGTVNKSGKCGNLNVVINLKVSVPEFGAIVAVGTLIVAGGALLIHRQHVLSKMPQ